jgi:CBS domain-containing protein
MKTCKEVMTSDPLCCYSNDTVHEAVQIMRHLDTRDVPVCDGRETKRLIGVVRDKDLLLRVIREGLDPWTTTVGDVMATDLFTCCPQDEVDRVLEAMRRRQVRHVPIVDATGRLVGMVAKNDIAAHVRPQDVVAKSLSRAAR